MEIRVYELYIVSNDLKTYMLHPGWNINIYSKCVDDVTRDGASLKWLCYIFSVVSKYQRPSVVMNINETR